MSARILLAPVLRRGMGSGHLMRCLSLLRDLPGETRILLPDSADRGQAGADTGLPGELAGMMPKRQTAAFSEIRRGDVRDLVIADRRETSRPERRKLASLGCLVGLDEGGGDRRFFPYLIDILPGNRLKHKPNVCSLSFLQLPRAASPSDQSGVIRTGRGPADPGQPLRIRRVLITFGGEDPAHLSQRLLRLLDRTGVLADCEITAVEGPAFGQRRWDFHGFCAGLTLLKSAELQHPQELKSRLGDFDLVFTSFGLTCFEALASGTPAVLLNPSRYHRRLSRRAGLPEIGMKKPSLSKLSALLEAPADLLSVVAAYRSELLSGEETLAQHVASLRPPASTACPSCGSMGEPAAARFRHRTYLRCRHCRLIFLLDFSGRQAVYGEDYFYEEYRRQYGRTYLEDFERIKSFAVRRLSVARRFIGDPSGKSLLDVGCAYGPFLQAAREEGYTCSGIDVAASAVAYVREELRIPCRVSSFSGYAGPKVHLLTMWFVIEHLRDLQDVLTKISNLLVRGGFFLFSTPNASGISGRRDLKAYLESSPLDHLTIWTPRAARRILKAYGFAVRAVRVTGHHPERFPLFRLTSHRASDPPVLKQGTLLWRVLEGASRLFRLGDTFEVYAEKIK